VIRGRGGLLAGVISALLVALGLVLGLAGPASAHSQVIASSPADGQRVETSPTRLTFKLSEPADISTMVVTLSGPSGEVDSLGAPVDEGTNDKGQQTIAVPVTATLPAGLYRVSFQATSKTDGHTALSQTIFGIRTDVSAPIGDDSAANSADPLDRLRTGLQGMILIGCGIAFGLLVLLPRATITAARGRTAAIIAAGVGLAGAVASGIFWHTGNGLIVSVLGALGSALLMLLALMPDVPIGRLRTWLAAAGLTIAVVPLSLVGHAAAQGTLATAVSALHIIATATWAGAVLGAAILLWRETSESQISVLRGASAIAGVTFIVALVTGLLLANDLVPSIAGLTGSLYGWGLMAKAALVVPVLLLALFIRGRLRGDRAGSIVPEAALLFVIMVIAVLVASTPPPSSARFQPTPTWTGDTAPVAVVADDLLVSFQINPNTPGTRFVVVRVDNTRRPAPAPIAGVSVDVGTGTPLTLTQGKDNLWTGGVEITEPGPSDLSISVTRPGLPVAIANTSWVVSPTPGTLAGGPSLTGLVTVLIVGLVAAWLLVLLVEGWRSSRRKVQPEPEAVTVG